MGNSTAVLDDVMEIAAPQETTAAAILSGIPEGRNADLPAWFRTRQKEAWARFAAMPMPTRKDQAWRFSNVNALDLTPFAINETVHGAHRRDILERSRLEEVAGRLIYADDHLLRRDPLSENSAPGVILQPLERGLVEHEELFRKFFMAQPAALGSAKFAALHEAFVRSGTFCLCPARGGSRAADRDLPLARHDNASVFPHTLLIADELSKVTVIEHFRSASPTAPGFACGVNDLVVGRGAKITYVCAQNWNQNVLALQMNTTTAEHDASAKSLNLHLGGAYSRFESLSRITGEGGPQRSAFGLRRWRRPGVRRPHSAGSRLAAHHERSALQKLSQRSLAEHLRRPHPRRTPRAFHRRLPDGAQSPPER